MTARPDVITSSKKVLQDNDLGGYTIPAKGLYPYQWNWDAALIAAGWAVFDEKRAWRELEMLFAGQWTDGMLPHIIFHKASPTYFPGPEIWQAPHKGVPTSGITQPPIAATMVRLIVEASPDKQRALNEARTLLPKLMAWHRWFYAARDPTHTGLVATLHPWESGMDNSPMWDESLIHVPIDKIPAYRRRDLAQVNSSMRPLQTQYDRYLTLLYRFKNLHYDPAKLYAQSPFRVTDICTNSLLLRADIDLSWLANELHADAAQAEVDGWIKQSRVAFATLWDPTRGLFISHDQLANEPILVATSGGFLPLFARVATAEQAAAMTKTLERWLAGVKFGVPSVDPSDPHFEARRYWRGPIWANINWMLWDGLRAYGYNELAERILRDTRTLIGKTGFYEYFDPADGSAAGAAAFSWTAAMALIWTDNPSWLQDPTHVRPLTP